MNHTRLALTVRIMSCRCNHEQQPKDFPWLIYEHGLKLMFCSRYQAAAGILSEKNLNVTGTSIFKQDNLMKRNKSEPHACRVAYLARMKPLISYLHVIKNEHELSFLLYCSYFFTSKMTKYNINLNVVLCLYLNVLLFDYFST